MAQQDFTKWVNNKLAEYYGGEGKQSAEEILTELFWKVRRVYGMAPSIKPQAVANLMVLADPDITTTVMPRMGYEKDIWVVKKDGRAKYQLKVENWSGQLRLEAYESV